MLNLLRYRGLDTSKSVPVNAEHSPVLTTLVRGPTELILGAVAGLAVGLLGCLFLPPLAHKDEAAAATSGRLPPQEGTLMVRGPHGILRLEGEGLQSSIL